MSKTIERDVIIVGAGPGGSAAAGYLAKQGIDVLVLDKETFPREKPCGDCQSHETYFHYEQLGCMDEYMSVAHPINGLRFIGPQLQDVNLNMDMSVCPRRILDNVIRKQAEKLGADVIEDCWVYDVIKENGQIKGVKAKYQGEYIDFRAKIVIGADGAHSIVAKKAGTYFDGDGDEMTIAVVSRCYFSNIKGLTDSIELFFDADIIPGYVWVFPYEKIEKGFANIGLGYYRGQYETNTLNELLDIWFKNPLVQERFRDAKMVGPMKGWRIPQDQNQQHTYGNGFMLIGDAAAQNAPASGEGISLAMTGGYYASIAAAEALRKNDFSAVSLKLYDDYVQKYLTPYYLQMRQTLDSMATEESINLLMAGLENSKELRAQTAYMFSGGNTTDGCKAHLGMKI